MGILEIGTQIGPIIPPGLRNFGVFLVPSLSEGVQCVQSGRLIYGPDFAFYDVADSEAANQLILKCYFAEVSKHGVENVQILSPQRRKGVVCSNRLNEQIREIANPPRNGVREIKCGGRLFREGDRIIQTKSEGDVSNGDVGVISAIREDGEEEPTIHIRLLDGREFEYSADMLEKVDLSYCISIHKSQGAEFPVVIIPILKEHYIMLRRKSAVYRNFPSQGKSDPDWSETGGLYGHSQE